MSKRIDISQQIRKYLNGELDAHAMHQLEKEALNDPFLAEALEGYEKAGTDQQGNIDDIRARLKTRINKKEARIIPWRMISIAASILIALTIGGLWLNNQQPTQKSKVATNIVLPPAKKNIADTLRQKQTLVATLTNKEKPKIFMPSAATSSPAIAENLTNAEPNAEINIDAPVGNSDTKVTEYAPSDKLSKKDSTAPAVSALIPNNVNLLTGKVAGVQVNPAPNSNQLSKEMAMEKLGLNSQAKQLSYSTATIKSKDYNTLGLKGIVKDETGTPLPGATVKVKGTNIVTQTDANGKFSINSVPDNTVLNIRSIGYNTKDIPVNKHDSLVIAMQPNQQALAEVVTTAYGISSQQEYQAAHPANGWSAFYKYLKDNAKSPDGKTGTVKLSFTVNTDNSLSGFKVLKSVSAKTDSAAIELVQNGPNWSKGTDNKPQTIRLRIKFTGNK